MTADGSPQNAPLLRQAAAQMGRVMDELRRQQQNLHRMVTNPVSGTIAPALSNPHNGPAGETCRDGLDRLQRALNAGQALADSIDGALSSAAKDPEGG